MAKEPITNNSSYYGFVESQFHQQFAENYNQISAYVITMLAGLLIGLTPFCLSAQSYIISICEGRKIIASQYLLLGGSLVAFDVCLIIIYLCIKQGWAIRRDQFIVYAIRFKEYRGLIGGKKDELISSCPFPGDYCPLDKLSPNQKPGIGGYSIANILVGTFEYLFRISFWTILAIGVVAICLYCSSWIVSSCSKLSFCPCIDFIPSFIIVVTMTLSYWLSKKWMIHIRDKYDTYNEIYKKQLSPLNDSNIETQEAENVE